jgi:hypothetical protein
VDLFQEFRRNITRRHFFAQGSNVIGWAALASLLGTSPGRAADSAASPADSKSTAKKFPPKAKHVIYLHMVGGPPQMDLYDYKPKMQEYYDKDLPDSIRQGQRLTTMTSGQAKCLENRDWQRVWCPDPSAPVRRPETEAGIFTDKGAHGQNRSASRLRSSGGPHRRPHGEPRSVSSGCIGREQHRCRALC